MRRRFALAQRPLLAALVAAALAGACDLAPKYQTPATTTPASYKELTPETIKETAGWKTAQPKDAVLRGKWWEIFGDPQLNSLEERVNVSNQSIVAAWNGFLAARAIVKEARAQYLPTITTSPSINVARQPSVRSQAAGGTRVTTYDLPFDATWSPDLWGKVRNTVAGDVAAAQASAADLANVRLAMQAELAMDYHQLRGQDTLRQLLDSTVVAYRESLELTKALYETGIDSDEAVAQAETQLEATEAQATGSGILRAQLEHAIAMLVGEPASAFSLPPSPEDANPPGVPLGVPSEVLERRPDVAAAERQVAQANAQIGVARAAFFPNLTLSASGGFESNRLSSWLTWPARFWSLGPSLAETLFDAGLREATIEQFKASYDQTVANYRQTVLTAFQQVEDGLASLRLLTTEVGQQDAAVKSAQRQLKVATDRYRLGIDPYLNVITAQTTVLSNQQAALSLRTQQMTATVQLIQALGGGWSTTELPVPPRLAVQEGSGPKS